MVSCNNSSNCHHQSQQPSPPPQQQQNGSSIYGIVNGSGCSTSGNYTVTLDDNLPSVGVSDNTSIPDTVSNPTFDCSHHTPVIVARSASSSSTLSSLLATTTIRDARTGIHIQHQYHSSSGKSLIRRGAIYGGSTITALPPHISCNSTTTGYHHSSNVTATPVVQSSSTSSFVCPSNFLQPYYSLSPSLSEFNVLQMCCQPLFTEIASQGTDISPSAESLYGFASRLHPITQTGTHYQLNMPQAYQTRNGYVGSTMTRPASAAGKRGGRRPKEYEEYDHVTLSEEERDKRDKRRLRNKEAAARCRQRRLDLMGSLQSQVNQLKEENKIKDAKIAELQLLKNELIAVIRDHHCILPEALRQTLDVDMSSTQQYMPRGAQSSVTNVPTSTDMEVYATSAPSPQPMLSNRKRAAAEMIPNLRQTSQQSVNETATGILSLSKIKQEPTLFDVNGRDLPDDEIKRPTSLSFADSTTTTSAYSSLSSSGVPITTPSNLIGGSGDFGVNLLDGPTGLTPCHLPQATAFQLSSMTTPLGEGRSFETL